MHLVSSKVAKQDLKIQTDAGVSIRGERAGEGPGIVLLHGLTATRRYVVMGSRLLERSGYSVVAYDARGHGQSSCAPEPQAYDYAALAEDLRTVLKHLEMERVTLVGASMGAHTALRLALTHPQYVSALCLITPAYDPDTHASTQTLASWDALAEGLRERGIDGFLDAYDLSTVPEKWRETIEHVIRQRLSLHEHPLAVADALESVPRSRPFEQLTELTVLDVPSVVVASRDEVDPGHPLSVAEGYAAAIPGARLIVEEAGPPSRSPIAWQGGRLSRVVSELAEQTLV